MKNVVKTNDLLERDIRGIIIDLGDLVALSTDREIKTGRVIGFKSAVVDNTGYTTVPSTVVVQCHGGYKPSFVRYSFRLLLCIERLGEGEALT